MALWTVRTVALQEQYEHKDQVKENCNDWLNFTIDSESKQSCPDVQKSKITKMLEHVTTLCRFWRKKRLKINRCRLKATSSLSSSTSSSLVSSVSSSSPLTSQGLCLPFNLIIEMFNWAKNYPSASTFFPLSKRMLGMSEEKKLWNLVAPRVEIGPQSLEVEKIVPPMNFHKSSFIFHESPERLCIRSYSQAQCKGKQALI